MVFIQIILAVMLVVLILLQSRGAGVGSIWGGGGEFYGTRRGIEKVLFRFTIFVSLLFIAISLYSVLTVK